MKCPTCDDDVPRGSEECPTCSTSVLDPRELALRLEDAGQSTTRHARPGEVPRPEATDNGHRFLPGTIWAGRYRISIALGRGGMGEVYRADDLVLQQPVALKLLPEAVERDTAKLAVLFEEVRLARRITHPNVCCVYDLGETEGRHFISMEYIDGEDLATLLRRIGRLPRAKALELAHQICGGLAAAHDQGVVHRDIKPTNLMIDGRGRARITDFGLAVATQNLELDTTIHGGTPAYMAPEQVDGGEISVKSDLYALGLVLYELFTGRKAFEGVRLKDLLLKRGELELTPPTELVDDLDPAIEREILRCLEVDPESRPASARALAAALPGGDADSAQAALWRPAEGRALPRRAHWVMERKLGEGGFGDVWLARHAGMGEKRVFKFCRGARHLHALKREITLFRVLKRELGERDDITRIFDWSFDEPPYYIESEYTHGGNLIAWAEDRGGIGQVPLETRLEIVAQVAEALAAAHSVGVLHKDVKPGNVLIDTSRGNGPRVRLSDFGVGLLTGDARLSEAGITPVSLTWTAAESGTPLYRAPELLEGKPSTVQADVYSLGVMLYQMVVGDLHRALGPGWEREIEDELLREDIAMAVDGSPQRRLGNALRVAEKLRRLDERRVERATERDAAADAERARWALDRLRGRLRWTGAAVAAGLLALAVTYQARRLGEEARANRQARQLVRVAAASDWLAKDPTRAALVLTEIDDPEETPDTVEMIYEVLGRELAWLELAHGEWVLDAAWSPDGRRLATASSDGSVRVWNADGSGRPIVLEGHRAPVLAVAWSPDGERLVTASQDATSRLLAPSAAAGSEAAGSEAVVLQGHGDWVWDVAWSPNGDRVATASWDRTARIWRLPPPGSPEPAAPPEPVVLEGHRQRVVSVAWSPDGERLATASWDGTARLWDKEGAPIRSAGRPLVLASPDALWTASWSPDGRRLATACWDGAARIWRLGTEGRPPDGPLVLQGRAGLWTASWSPNGERLATASWDGTARIWNVDGTPVRRAGEPVVLRHGDSVVSASWSPDGRRLVTASRDATARVWNADGAPIRPVGILSQRDREGVVLAGHGGEIWTASWSPDGGRIVTASRDGTARVWRTDFGTRLESEIVRDVEPVTSGRREHRSPDGRQLAVVDEEGRVSLTSDAGETRLLGRVRGEIVTVSWSPRGRRLLVAARDGVVRVWNLASAVTGDELVFKAEDAQSESAALLAAAFSADGERLFTAGSNGTVRRWNADGSGEAMVFGGPSAGAVPSVPPGGGQAPGLLVSAEFDRGADRLLTVSQGGIAEVWSLDSYPAGRALAFVPEEAPVVSAWWGRDGQSVVAPLWDGTVREWRLEVSVLVDYLRSATRVCLDADFRMRNLGETAAEARSGFEECERSQGR